MSKLRSVTNGHPANNKTLNFALSFLGLVATLVLVPVSISTVQGIVTTNFTQEAQ